MKRGEIVEEKVIESLKAFRDYLSSGIWNKADVLDAFNTALDLMDRTYSEWTEKHVSPIKETGIEEVQMAKCKNCGLWHTTPYLYYFTEYEYCPHCGARMKKVENVDLDDPINEALKEIRGR